MLCWRSFGQPVFWLLFCWCAGGRWCWPWQRQALRLRSLYLAFADAYGFYSAAVAKRTVRHTGRAGSVFAYLTRYLMANKSYLINTVGLCAIACFLPLLFGEFQGLNMFPIGLAILCLNTPICTLLSCDPDLEQAIRVLPEQVGTVLPEDIVCLSLSSTELLPVSTFVSWQIINGSTDFIHVITLLLFALQSAILSVILEWKTTNPRLENRKRFVASSTKIYRSR